MWEFPVFHRKSGEFHFSPKNTTQRLDKLAGME